jgi:hypothetical protein
MVLLATGLRRNPIMFHCDAAFKWSAGLFASINAVGAPYKTTMLIGTQVGGPFDWGISDIQLFHFILGFKPTHPHAFDIV